VIWDPNPQFHDVDLGQAKIYRWKDKEGRDWEGGLYLPSAYRAGQRYPLVIQTHGFTESVFLPSGSFPTAFAGRELAAAGIAVLQIGGGKACGGAGPEEASCEVAGFEAGARQLATEGIVDLQKVGYIGFSRSCWYGMEFLTNGTLPLKAALLADGITVDYLLFALTGTDFADEIGAKPFGQGLETWVKRSPGFHLDKVAAPLLIDGQRDWIIHMWQPYAGLKYLKKPVELDLINTDEHTITNPVERMASQGLSVDWFRFWLKGEEDPAPAKKDQYERWRKLRAPDAQPAVKP
jgi:dipeptidyl aminopeptidase/acylaminoacyl peptidase